MTDIIDVRPEPRESNLTCNRCTGKVAWLNFSHIMDIGVCGCPWTVWTHIPAEGVVHRAVPDGVQLVNRDSNGG